jgi:DNA-binding NarL/FixJ family response regulator
MLTTFEVDEYVFEAIRAGASGFLLKDCEPTELLQAVRIVAAGEALLSPRITRTLIAAFVAQPRRMPVAPLALRELTEREREVLVLVGAGRSNDEIAEQLVITASTAKTHVSRAMSKLGARDRAQLVVIAYETGLLTPGLG